MLAFYTNLACRFRRDEKGATAVEYGIMVALIAIAIIVAVTLLSTELTVMFETASCGLRGDTYTASTATGSTFETRCV